MEKVAVYGTLRKGQHNNYLLVSANYLGTGNTVEKYRMASYGIPYVSEKEEVNKVNVIVDLYEVNDKQLDRLDILENHPNWYQRKEIDVLIDGETHKAWLYFNEVENYDTMKNIKNGDYINPTYFEREVAMGV